MANKIGRNDPCPCGSGRKFKHCCGGGDAAQGAALDSHEHAVSRAMAWLGQKHQKAFSAALAMAFDDAIEGLFADDEQAQEALAGLDPETWTQIQINLTEWLLAEDDIEVKGEFVRVADLLQGPGGPLLSVEQRAWLAQLAQRPLRLYDVTDVVPGATLTLCDALDREAEPVIVTERSGSRTLRPGMCIGARVMDVDGQHQLSGAVYPFSQLGARAALGALLAGEDEDGEAIDEDPDRDDSGSDDDALLTGLTIIDCWLEQLLLPPSIPDIVDASTGEPLVLTTDHYEVGDWAALETALTAQADVEGDRAGGWSRRQEGADGQTRARAIIAPSDTQDRLTVFYRTVALADEGRPWFDALAGDAVRHRLREHVDPKGALSRPGAITGPVRGSGLPEGVDPAVAADLIEGALRRSYARWADEPIPALDDKTPREAIATPAGLERVKGLLRSYEEAEARQAAQQGRRTLSFQFLWDAVGIER